MARKTGSHSQITGPKVREVAQRLFARDGFAAVSMRQIAAEVGVQAGALYNYTPDKQSLLFDLMRSHMEELHAAWSAETLPEHPVERLEHFTRFHIRFHVARPDAVFIAYMELRNLSPENFAVIDRLRQNYECIVDGILEEGQEKGLFKFPDRRLATMAVIAMLTGINTWYHEGGRLPLHRVERIYCNMVRRVVKGRMQAVAVNAPA